MHPPRALREISENCRSAARRLPRPHFGPNYYGAYVAILTETNFTSSAAPKPERANRDPTEGPGGKAPEL